MEIIEIAALSNGAHRNQNGVSSIPDGWIAISGDKPTTFPFVDVSVDGTLTADQDAYNAAMAAAEKAEQNNTPVTLESFATQLEATQSVLDALLMGNITI